MYNTNNKSSFSERITEGPTHHLKKGSQVQEQQLKKKKKRLEKCLLFFRATHASTLQTLACVSISEVNSIFFR